MSYLHKAFEIDNFKELKQTVSPRILVVRCA